MNKSKNDPKKKPKKKKTFNQKTKNLLLKGIKEIAFVMLGVLLALFFRNQNLEKKERIKEELILFEMKNDLIKDLFDVNWNIDCGSRIMNSMYTVVDHLESKTPYHDSLSHHYDMLYYHIQFETSIAAYEQLKSSGLQVVQNNELRSLIVELYAKQYEIVKRREDNLLHPFYVNRMTNEMQPNVNFDMITGRVSPSNVVELYGNTSFSESLKSEYIFKEIERNKYIEIKFIIESILTIIDQDYPDNNIPYCKNLEIFGTAVSDASGIVQIESVDDFSKKWQSVVSLDPGELKFKANNNMQMSWGSDIPGFLSSLGNGILIKEAGEYEISFNIYNWTYNIQKI